MGVVARLTCHAVEETAWSYNYKLQPVVTQDDPHDEEIKRFFASTPAGNVQLSKPLDDPLDMRPKQQFYLYLEDNGNEPQVEVSGIHLDGWATRVTLVVKPERAHLSSTTKLEFTIRNETAAEQFQPGARFHMRLEKVGDAS